MTQVFTWPVDSKLSGTVTLRARKAQFGDGYAQRVGDGINNKAQSWPISITDDKSVITAVAAFLDALGGYQSFYWTPPLGVQGYYTCDTYQPKQVNGNIWQLTATFEQSFQP